LLLSSFPLVRATKPTLAIAAAHILYHHDYEEKLNLSAVFWIVFD